MLSVVRSKLCDNRIIVLLIVIVACLAYLPTVQPDISATNNPYFSDVGNVQNGLSQWGTLHSSGYPLFSLLGAIFVTGLRLVGVVPAAAASLFSTLWAIGALVIFYILIVTWLSDRVSALIATALLGVGWGFWLFGSYAEVYSMIYFIVIVALYSALKADRTRQVQYLYILAICCGLCVAHHRAIALALPAPLLIAAPALWSKVRRSRSFIFKWSGLALAAGVVPYLYLLIRSLQHAAWIWGDPSTPTGFWSLMTGATYLRLIVWPKTIAGWLDIVQQVLQALTNIMTWPFALLGVFGIIGLIVRRRYRYGFALFFGACLPLLAAVADQTFHGSNNASEDIPALAQISVIFLLLACAFLLSNLKGRWMVLRRGGLMLGIATSVVLIVQNQPVIYDMTHDTTGRQLIANAQRFVQDAALPSPPAFFSPWGGEFWALAYGRDVTQAIKNFNLLPNRANLKEAADQYDRIYTFQWTLYTYNLAWWKKHLDNPSHVYLSSAGDNVVAIAAHPLLSANDLPDKTQAPVAMGSSISLSGWAVTPIDGQSWLVTLYWQALSIPDRDYSVFVHASDRDVIDMPDAIIAQADSDAPVYGWYPTSRWSPNEIIRDDHVLVVSADRVLKTIAVGLYYQDESGAFHNLGQQVILIPTLP